MLTAGEKKSPPKNAKKKIVILADPARMNLEKGAERRGRGYRDSGGVGHAALKSGHPRASWALKRRVETPSCPCPSEDALSG